MNEKERKDIEILIRDIMEHSISNDYIGDILDHTKRGKTFLADVIDDVIETSALNDEGYYNEDDIRLAIGRVFLDRLGIEY